jgi:hypothetical protein
MPRPTHKAQLLEAMQTEHTALDKVLADLTPEQMTAVSAATPWSIKDILAHLSAWEQLCLGWYKAGQRGQTPALPAEGFNWAQIPALNKQIFETHRARPLAEVKQQYQASYRRIYKTVEAISEEELFTPRLYAWTNKNALATYFISATSSHYAWARKEVRKCLKG